MAISKIKTVLRKLARRTVDGLFDVYVVSTSGTEPPVKLVDGQDNTAFESLRILSPGLAWDPTGERLAVSVKSGPTEAIAIVDVATRETRHYRVPGAAADFHALGITPQEVDAHTDSSIAARLDRKPLAGQRLHRITPQLRYVKGHPVCQMTGRPRV